MRTLSLMIALGGITLLTACGGTTMAEDRTAIINLLQATYGGAASEVTVEPVVVRMQYGIADWTHTDRGGRVLVRKQRGGWTIIAAGGDELRDPEFLAKAGVPEPAAKALVNMLIAAERGVSEHRLAVLATHRRTATQ